MADMISGGAVEMLIFGFLQRRDTVLHGVALILCLCELDPAGTPHRWFGQCGVGAASEAIRALSVPVTTKHHPILATVRDAAATGGLTTGSGKAKDGPLFAGNHWCGMVLDHSLADPACAVLLGISPQPFSEAQSQEFTHISAQISAALAGAEAALREKRDGDQLALLMRYAANPIVLSDVTAIISMNEPATRLFDVVPAPSDTERNEQVNAIARNLTKLHTFLAEVNSDPNTVHTGEIALEDPRTLEEVVMAAAASHVPEALGGMSGIVTVLHDMTRARELEHHRVRQQLFESEKLAATGRLAASIAHEINNPLEAIKNSLYLLVRQTARDDPNRQFLELAQRETERVSRIIRQMLGVSRPSVATAPTEVNEVLQDALQLLGPQLRQSRITPTVELSPRLPHVMASSDQLKQVFLNLVLNAKEAMPKGGGLLVQTRLAHEGDAEFLAGKHVIVRIRDDGAGIPPDILPHVFEPFFSTKTERHGTGLGLWVCQDIIQHHGGHILVRSMVGKGTTFLVALPFIVPDSIPTEVDHHDQH